MPGREGHAAKCLGPPLDPISYWSRGKMPGTLEEELVDAQLESEAGFPCPLLMIRLDTESKLHLVTRHSIRT